MTSRPKSSANDASRSTDEEQPVPLIGATGADVSTEPSAASSWRTWLSAQKWILASVAIIIFAGAYFLFRHFEGTAVATDVVRRGDLVETVVASGHVESPFRVDISSQITGKVVSVLVREGETVAEGQLLVQLSADELENAADQAQATVAQAAANVRQISEVSLPQALEAQSSAASSLVAAQQIFDRTSALMPKGFVTRASFDDAKKNRDVARTQVAAAAALVRSARSAGSGYALAQADLAQASAGSSAAKSRLAYTAILAPRAGVLISRSVERGTVVTPGASLMVLSPRTSPQIVVQIDERNLGKIVVGQSAIVSADAFPRRTFRATVAYINPGIDLARASATVKLDVPDPPAYLRQDMTVSVDIETARRKAVVSLPGNSVHDALSPAPWVMIVENGRAVRRNIRLGLQGNSRTEVLSGVEPGIGVIPASSGIAAGARVRPAAQ